MKKIISYAAIAALSLAGFSSCSEDLEAPRASGLSGAIRFGLVQNNATKGIGTTSTNFLSQIRDFQVWAYYDSTATGEGVEPGGRYIGVSDTEGTFIDGNGSGGWDYRTESHLQYWPATTAPLNFQAITPATDASFTISNTPADDLSHLTAVVNVPTDVKLQKDIMFAKADKQTYESNANCVSLVFKHGLSQVVFNGRLASNKITAEVSSIEIVNVHSKGNVGYFASDASLGSEVTGEAESTFSLGIAADNIINVTTPKSLTSEDGALLMLPQDVTAWATTAGNPVSTSDADAAHNSYLKIKCTVTDNTSGTVLINDEYVYIPFEISWEQGKKYTYTLVFGDMSGGYDENGESLENMLPVTYTVATSDDWVGVDGGEFGIGGKDQEPTVDLLSYIKATYNVPSGEPIWIYSNDPSEISKMYIDGEEVSPTNEYTFSTDGDHTVHYSFVDPINIPTRAFWECPLTSVTIPNSVESIGGFAFSDCPSLTSVTIPNSVTSIGECAFFGCSGLSSVTIPNSVTSIGECAFFGCSGLSSVTISEGVETIASNAFSECSALTSVTIPNSVTSLGECAFSGCIGLTSITLGNGLTSIGQHAFQGCSGLTSVTIPNSVESIGGLVFGDCYGLTTIRVEENNLIYDSRDNCNAIIETASNTLIHACKATTIPEGVETIGHHAFQSCKGLTSVTIPNSVTSIGDFAFGFCSGLTSVTIPEGVETIGHQAFSSCPNLSNITCLAYPAPSLGTGVFSGVASEGILSAPSRRYSDYSTWMSSLPSEWEFDSGLPN